MNMYVFVDAKREGWCFRLNGKCERTKSIKNKCLIFMLMHGISILVLQTLKSDTAHLNNFSQDIRVAIDLSVKNISF